MAPEKIIKLANNIAVNQGAYEQDEAVQRIANHINMFWTPAMKDILHELAASKDSRLHSQCILAHSHIH